MGNKTGNYTAFYVNEPFNENNLGAHSTKDFVYYNMLRAWKGKDSSFPFIDSHNKNYNFISFRRFNYYSNTHFRRIKIINPVIIIDFF